MFYTFCLLCLIYFVTKVSTFIFMYSINVKKKKKKKKKTLCTMLVYESNSSI